MAGQIRLLWAIQGYIAEIHTSSSQHFAVAAAGIWRV